MRRTMFLNYKKNRRSTAFETLKLGNGSLGLLYVTVTFHSLKASTSGDLGICVAYERRTTYFKDPKLRKGPSGNLGRNRPISLQ